MADRLAIYSCVGDRDRAAAEELEVLFRSRAAQLTGLPHLGRPGRIDGTRELTVHRNYRLIYEIRDASIVVLNVVHASRNWPPTELLP